MIPVDRRISGFKQKAELAICAPIFNEEEGISNFLARVDQACEAIIKQSGAAITLILVDDGSRDRGPDRALEFKSQYCKEMRLISLSRNFGHAPAVSALFNEAREFDAMILMDADLQDTPEILPELFSFWLQGYDSVRVERGRRAEGIFFSIFSKLFYRAFERLSGLRSGIGNFGLYDRRVVDAISSYPEKVRYVPGIITLAGFQTHIVTVDRAARAHGESRVGFKGLVRLAMTALFSFSTLPLQLMAIIGFFISAVAVVGALIVLFEKFFTNNAIPGWASFLTAQFFFGGLIVFCLGVIGQYIGIIFEEVKARPIYFAQKKTVQSYSNGQNKNQVPETSRIG